MKARFRLLRLDLLRLTRSTGVAAAVVLLLAIGVYAAWRGGRSVEAAGSSVAAAETAYRDQLAYLLSVYPPTTEAGEVLYYAAFPAPQPSLRLAALARGRTEVETASLRVGLLALEGQLYEHDTVNPRLAAAGDLDLAFLLIGLLPLFIIALTYDLVSSEREGGTWNLVRLFALPRRLLALKLASRVCLAGVVVAVPVFVAASLAGLPLDGRAAWAVALIALHTFFWFALCLGVASRRRSSTANAMILVGTWVALTLLAPRRSASRTRSSTPSRRRWNSPCASARGITKPGICPSAKRCGPSSRTTRSGAPGPSRTRRSLGFGTTP